MPSMSSTKQCELYSYKQIVIVTVMLSKMP